MRALQRDGWVVVRQKGSHIRMQKHVEQETLKIIVPAHKPIKRTTLAKLLKDGQVDLEHFLTLV